MQWFKRLSHLNGLKCEGRRKLWTERRTDGGTENWTLISRLAKAGVTKMQEFSSLLMTHRLNVMHAPVKFHEYISYHLGVMAPDTKWDAQTDRGTVGRMYRTDRGNTYHYSSNRRGHKNPQGMTKLLDRYSTVFIEAYAQSLRVDCDLDL